MRSISREQLESQKVYAMARAAMFSERIIDQLLTKMPHT